MRSLIEAESKFRITASLAWQLFGMGLAISLLSGCGGSSVVKAVPRTDSANPVYNVEAFKENADDPNANSEASSEFDFFHEDHFAVLEIDVGKLIAMPDLADIPWKSLEDQLVPLVGRDNASLSKIGRLWVLVDRETISLVPSAETSSPMVYVLEYKTPLDDKQLISAQSSSKATAANSPTASEPQLATIKLGKSKVAFGLPEQLKKLETRSSSRTILADRFLHTSRTADINGLLVIAPIQRLLRNLLGMAAQFGDQGAQLAALPDLLTEIELKLSVTDDEMLIAIVHLSDEKVTKELARTINDRLVQSSSSASMLGPIMNQGSESILNLQSPQTFQELGNEIKTQALLSVVPIDSRIEIKLKQPSNTKAMIAAIVSDSQQAALLVQRQIQLQRIGIALQQYEEKYKHLPSAEAVSNVDGTPNQFSWRVALLPFLGEQELYDRFDFSKPWDSAENMRVADSMPQVFANLHITDNQNHPNQSRLNIVEGTNAVYRSDRSLPRLTEITDKKIWTAVVIEGGLQSASHWTDPRPIDFDSIDEAKVGQEGENGILIIDASFKPRIVKRSRENLQAVISSDGSEPMTRRDFIKF